MSCSRFSPLLLHATSQSSPQLAVHNFTMADSNDKAEREKFFEAVLMVSRFFSLFFICPHVDAFHRRMSAAAGRMSSPSATTAGLPTTPTVRASSPGFRPQSGPSSRLGAVSFADLFTALSDFDRARSYRRRGSPADGRSRL